MRGAAVLALLTGCYQPATLTGSDGGVITSGTATLTAGDAFACRVDSGNLTCWGRNTDGEILGFAGDAATTPQPIMGAWKSADAGGFHVCAIAMDDQLHCWGRDSSGQVDGAIALNNAPLGDTVLTFDNHRAWLQVAAGRDHTCAIAIGGALYCWGDNSNAELGTSAGTVLGAIHVQVQGDTPDDWTLVATGTRTTCGVSTSKGLVCWGNNDNGQIGTGANPGGNATPVPIAVPGTVTSVAMARDSTCAVADGQLFCWGYGQNGQLAETHGTNVLVPSKSSAMDGWKRVESSSTLYMCGIRDDGGELGELWCWGGAHLGGLGNGLFFSDSRFDKIGDGATALAVGFVDDESYTYTSNPGIDFIDLELTCAVMSNTTTCWGDDRFGELGDGKRTRASTPVPVSIPAQISAIAAGVAHVCALDNTGQVWCWGDDINLELGAPVAGCPPSAECTGATPQQVPSLTGVATVVAGRAHTCALHDSTALRCWGASSDHRLGGGGTNVFDLSNLNGLSILRASGETTCVDETTTGNPTCFGALLPLPDTTQPAIQDMDFDFGAVLAFGGVAGAPDHRFGCELAVDTNPDFHVRCTGDNTFGQFGDGVVGGSAALFNTDTNVHGVDITVGYDAEYVCAVDTARGVTCWGLNDRGQQGVSPTVRPQTATPVSLLASGSNCTRIAGGTDGACAICAGNMMCWGGNMEGQVGDGQPQITNVVAPTAIKGSNAWEQVAGGERFFCGLASGQVSCWGLGQFGELGNGAATANRPMQTVVAP